VGRSSARRTRNVVTFFDGVPVLGQRSVRAVFAYPTEAEADLEKALTERVQRFLEFFGKPEDGRVVLPVAGTGR
jgi:hypothetical protein